MSSLNIMDREVEVVSGLVSKVIDESPTNDFLFNNERNTVVNPLNFGNLVWAPTIATDVIRTVNNSTRRDLMTMPRYSHIVNLPILLEFNVSDIENVVGKVTINNHVVG